MTRRCRVSDVHVYRERCAPRNWREIPSDAVARPRWFVSVGGRRVSRHRTQAAAIRAGIRLAKRISVDLVTHGRTGRIRSKDSYGNESPVRDTEH